MILKMWLFGTSFLVGVIAFDCSPIWAQDSPETGFHASLDGEFRYGNIEGFVQIPRGGGAGTTSSQRPTFSEIGIKSCGYRRPLRSTRMEQSQSLWRGTHYQAFWLGRSQ